MGFVGQRHDGIQNLLASLLSKICKDVEVEPHQEPPSQVCPEARLDIKAESFWSRGETAFFDV